MSKDTCKIVFSGIDAEGKPTRHIAVLPPEVRIRTEKWLLVATYRGGSDAR